MKKNKNLILTLIFVLFVILLIIIGILQISNKPNEDVNIITIKEDTIKDIIENSGSKYIEEFRDGIIQAYVVFKNNLYDREGNSNRSFFESIIDKIVNLEKADFELIDEAKNIAISVTYNKDTGEYTYQINDISNYFYETDGEIYKELLNAKMVEKNKKILVASNVLLKLSVYDMNYSMSELGEGIELEDGYFSYKDDTIRAKKVRGIINNIIFTEKYEGQIYNDISVDTKLEKVIEILGENVFGSIREGYIGYRNGEIYTFFYGDKVSAYGYKYKEDKKFDSYLESYISSGNLSRFEKSIRNHWVNYELYEYDETEQNLYMSYPSYGIEINIKNNDSKGIVIYNNCYKSKTIEKYLKEGKITLKNCDYINIIEQNRVNN